MLVTMPGELYFCHERMVPLSYGLVGKFDFEMSTVNIVCSCNESSAQCGIPLSGPLKVNISLPASL